MKRTDFPIFIFNEQIHGYRAISDILILQIKKTINDVRYKNICHRFILA